MRKYQKFIFKNTVAPLSSVPFHTDTDCIERYFPEGFPLHLAVHKVSEVTRYEEYAKLHTHDVHELNIIIGEEDYLEFRIQMGDETYTVKSNASIWIPAGLPHSANALKGSGYYIAIRLDPIEDKFFCPVKELFPVKAEV